MNIFIVYLNKHYKCHGIVCLFVALSKSKNNNNNDNKKFIISPSLCYMSYS